MSNVARDGEVTVAVGSVGWATDWTSEPANPLRVETALRFYPDEVFRIGEVGTSRHTLWLVIDGAAAHVRAASADRQRFVFRDLVVAQPLTDLDRERIGDADHG